MKLKSGPKSPCGNPRPMATPESQDTPASIDRAVQQACNRSTYYPFGDDGVTATVDASGGLLQMTRFFPGREFKTGFCVDNSSIEEPYFVTDRFGTLFSRATNPFSNEGIDVDIYLPLEFDSPHPARPQVVHDRWPRFALITVDDIRIEIQYLASGGTIYKTVEFDFCTSKRSRDLPTVSCNKDLLIRDLDFIDHANRLNDAKPDDPSYETRVSDQGFLIRSHRVHSETHVVLFISAFSDEKFLKFEKKDDNDYQLQWCDDISERFKDQGKFEITITYTLEFFSEDQPVDAPFSPPIPKITIEQLQQKSFEPQHFTKDPQLDPLLGQNLENILSVCSIPVTCPDNSGTRAIALTCGDLDGHRVATAASFYSFQFLLLALGHFKAQRSAKSDCECGEAPREECCSYVCRMTARIHNTCKGHLKWLFQTAKRPRGFFAPHYWVNGSEITDWEDNDYLSGKALVDTPFQIIKAGDFQSLLGREEISDEVKEGISEVTKAWIEDLDKSNKMGLYAFPRCRKEPTDNFYFTDHVIIWRALKAVEGLGLNLPQIPAIDEKKAQIDSTRQNQRVRDYSSARVQQNIVKRFTTENPLSSKQMIAVSRSPGKSRFLLRNKDAALFHAMELGFFDKPGAERGDDLWRNKIDAWKNTIDSQMYHEDNDDADWDEPLRYALSIIMTQHGKRMNGRSVNDMRAHAMSVLLQSSSPNGLFPGALDETNEPILYKHQTMRDTYWGVTFEIPYILWNHGFLPADSTPPANTYNQSLRSGTSNQTPTAPFNLEFAMLLKAALEQHAGRKGPANTFGYSMKQNLPFNNVVYQENIVELSDEWLYNMPSFFVPPGIEQDISGEDSRFEFMGTMVDVPRSKYSKRKMLSIDPPITVFTTHWALSAQMRKGRTPYGAKKRLWTFFATDPRDNEICWQTSPSLHLPDHEHDAARKGRDKDLAAFCDRHKFYHKFFMEDTAPVLNSWTTELHLSFYEIDHWDATAKPRAINPSNKVLYLTNLQGNKSTSIKRVVMSFRLDGDFFDRYWTCWFLEAGPRVSTWEKTSHSITEEVRSLLEGELHDRKRAVPKKAPWRQRRILELLLFDRVIRQMRVGADEILRRAELIASGKIEGLGNRDLPSLDWSPDAGYIGMLAVNKRYQRIRQILRAVEGDLTENLVKIDLWSNREEQRRGAEPRWPLKDENRYRGVISKLLISNAHHVQQLKLSHASITRFKEELTKELEIIRDTVDQRRANDIQRFTYVTIVFLPLGFATGLFSMNGTPDGRTLNNMIYTAIAGFGIVALLLMMGSKLEAIISLGYRPVRECSKKLMKSGISAAVLIGKNSKRMVEAMLRHSWRKDGPEQVPTREEGQNV
ncbi:Mg2+ transporter -like Zinc transport [Fusarium albosuccineum]|uniref:Mg2+ transporter -like Zinc transport n=1 Tax=Fusarium albosuccineum TaxID=1237068 RepID=A0A8H4L4Y4_9HYPO|nr:Mg2+ transporter -like Zinc transport [Fusarium albosuccineum]